MMSKNQQKKALKRERQAYDAVRALASLLEEVKDLTSRPNEVEERLKLLSYYIHQYAMKNDNSSFKNIIAFSEYYKFKQRDREEKVKREIKKNRKEELRWYDFKAEILSLFEDGKSNESIAQKIRERGVKCNRETIRQFINNRNK